jgi:hypothetical protein
MTKRYRADQQIATAMIIPFAFGFLLMSVPLMTSGAFLKFAISWATVGGLLVLLWLGFAHGTYVTIDENKNLYGTLCFFRGRVTFLSDVVSIHQRHTFGGLMAEVYMKYRKKDGTIAERGIISKQGIKNSEFKNLLDAIRSANPNIKIEPDLLDK